MGGVTDKEQGGASGKINSNTLKIKTHLKNKYDGNGTWAPEQYSPEELNMIIPHEVMHATEAVANLSTSGGDFNRSGLRVNEFGRPINEGMTEFLTEYSQKELGKAYRTETLIMYQMYKDHFPLFAQLYKTYHGEIDNPHELERAINKYQDINRYFLKYTTEANRKQKEFEKFIKKDKRN